MSKSYDLGGAYGESSEAAMMKEILRNGALNTEFQAPSVFGTYREGILSETGISSLQKLSLSETAGLKASEVSKESLDSKGIAWQNLNHSVVVLGWGVDQGGQKFWIVRNSYGPSWGMEGDFLLRRGHDDFGFESEQVSFEAEALS